jgi:hypothetical protein
MSTATTEPTIIFPDWYDEQAEFEATARGYLSHIVVQTEGGSRYQVQFYDPVRLAQDLTSETESGRGYLAEPNMIVLSEVSTENVRRAVHGLWREGFFKHLKPL